MGKYKNPIKTTYQLLWEKVKRDDIDCICLQNTMRRIIEFYFNTLADINNNQLIGRLENEEEKAICMSLIAWMNAGSHEVFDEYNYTFKDTDVKKYKAVFKKIFEKTGHLSHYEMMMGEYSHENRNE